MKFVFVTLFPEQIEAAAGHSVLKRALDTGIIAMECVNPRDFSLDRHHSVDDAPFGGGVGMVLKPEPVVEAIKAAKAKAPGAPVIAMSPGGVTFRQSLAETWAKNESGLIFVCGHYEGFDERIYHWVDRKVSIGDFVLTGGELPALLIMDAVSRFVPGVLGKLASAEECWANWPARKRIPSPAGCWNIPSIPVRWCLKAWKCRKCCATATTG